MILKGITAAALQHPFRSDPWLGTTLKST